MVSFSPITGYLFILSSCDSTLYATTLQQLNPRYSWWHVDRRPSAQVPVWSLHDVSPLPLLCLPVLPVLPLRCIAPTFALH